MLLLVTFLDKQFFDQIFKLKNSFIFAEMKVQIFIQTQWQIIKLIFWDY